MTGTSPLVGAFLRMHRIVSRGLNVSIQKCDEYLRAQGIPSEEAVG
jgi:hypothetical protein